MSIINVFLLALHLLAVNVATAGPLACIWLHRRGAGGDEAAWQVGRRLARLSLSGLLIGVFLGLLQLALAWAGAAPAYWGVIARIPTRDLVYVLIEVAFSATCLAVYAGMWNLWRARPWLHAVVALLAATNLLYHFPPMMTVLGELAAQTELTAEGTLTRSLIKSLMARPEVISLIVHFIVASAAVTGVVLMLLARQHATANGESVELHSNKLVAAGAWIALVASLAQLGIGTWVVVELPTHARNGLIGDDTLTALMFAASLLAAFGILNTLAKIALGDSTQSAVHRATLLMLAIVLLMTATLARSRQLSATRVAKHAAPTLNALLNDPTSDFKFQISDFRFQI